MAARAFKIDRYPPRPLSVEKTAQKYRVSRSALNDIKTFVAGFVGTTDEPTPREWKAGRNSKFTAVAVARKSAERRRSAIVHRKDGTRKVKGRKRAGRTK